MSSSDEYARPEISENCNIKNYFSEKLLGITFDCKLKFSSNIEVFGKK